MVSPDSNNSISGSSARGEKFMDANRETRSQRKSRERQEEKLRKKLPDEIGKQLEIFAGNVSDEKKTEAAKYIAQTLCPRLHLLGQNERNSIEQSLWEALWIKNLNEIEPAIPPEPGSRQARKLESKKELFFWKTRAMDTLQIQNFDGHDAVLNYPLNLLGEGFVKTDFMRSFYARLVVRAANAGMLGGLTPEYRISCARLLSDSDPEVRAAGRAILTGVGEQVASNFLSHSLLNELNQSALEANQLSVLSQNLASVRRRINAIQGELGFTSRGTQSLIRQHVPKRRKLMLAELGRIREEETEIKNCMIEPLARYTKSALAISGMLSILNGMDWSKMPPVIASGAQNLALVAASPHAPISARLDAALLLEKTFRLWSQEKTLEQMLMISTPLAQAGAEFYGLETSASISKADDQSHSPGHLEPDVAAGDFSEACGRLCKRIISQTRDNLIESLPHAFLQGEERTSLFILKNADWSSADSAIAGASYGICSSAVVNWKADPVSAVLAADTIGLMGPHLLGSPNTEKALAALRACSDEISAALQNNEDILHPPKDKESLSQIGDHSKLQPLDRKVKTACSRAINSLESQMADGDSKKALAFSKNSGIDQRGIHLLGRKGWEKTRPTQQR